MAKPVFLAQQGRCPSGVLGHIVAWVMARETKSENLKTLELLDLSQDDDVLEIGFGHGETLQAVSKLVRRGTLAGVEFSDVMLTRASSLNRDLIRNGQLELRKGDSRELPFGCKSFDKVFTVHTIYFWDDPLEDLEEVYRVLRPGGRFVIAYRSSDDKQAINSFPASIYSFRTVDWVENTLDGLGFANISTQTGKLRNRLLHWTSAHRPEQRFSPSVY
ncbi:MAG: class I SAM-dependent methyltransferase [Rhizobiaceae bacterium]